MGLLSKLFGAKASERKKDSDDNNNNNNDNNDRDISPLASKNKDVEVFNLKKKTELLETICLKKGFKKEFTSRVAIVLDYSGSMSYMYNKGIVQKVVERLLPVGIRFDDNQAIDMFIFSSDNYCKGKAYADLGEVSPKNFTNWVNNNVCNEYRFGCTEYAPVIKYITNKYKGKKKDPAYVIFITDGDTSGKEETKKQIINSSKHPIFWQFIGIGGGRFSFLEELDGMDGRKVDNANFQEIKSISDISDEDLYDMLMTEYPLWIKEATRVGII